MARKYTTTSRQINFFEDHFEHSHPSTQKAVTNSWAGPFGERFFPLIDEAIFDPLYASSGRPSAPISLLYGACILQQLHGISDDELLLRIMTDLTFQYALHTTTNEMPPFSKSTLRRFKTRLIMHYIATDNDLFNICTQDILKKLKAEPEPVPKFLRRAGKLTAESLRPASKKHNKTETAK
ncbi:MAG: transposase [Clostridia bacterium]|nr:transposase [Clostridia bacterium]